MNFSVANLLPKGVSYSSYYYFVTEFGDSIGDILYYFEGKIQMNMKPNQSYSEMTKFAGIFLNSAILLGLFVHYFLNKRGKTLSLNTSLLPENNAALLLVTNLCLIDLTSVIILYIIVPNILSDKFTSSESCAIKVSAFCFINLGTTLTTFLIGLERWIMIMSFQKHERIFSKFLILLLVGLVWILTLMFCVTAFYLTSKEKSSSAFFCRTSSLSATPMLLTKPSLVLTFSLILFFMYGDILRRFWAFKKRKEEWQKKYLSNLDGKNDLKIVKNLYKGTKIFEDHPPARLTGFKMCEHQNCKVQREVRLNNYIDILVRESKAEKIFRYFKDSKYVICIVITYFFSWVPWLLTFFTDSFLVAINFYYHQAEDHCGDYNATEAENLLSQIEKKHLLEDFSSIEALEETALCGALTKYYEDATFEIITRFYVFCGAFSCIVDPLIYALWYEPIRRRGREVWMWISKDEDNRLSGQSSIQAIINQDNSH